ncbi:MAG: RHS repeat-associated core domain-containing protein [Paludibacteraceae bacterium]|nr:RHS repeat-associated core domain-containing protein [Paludibacteraceae bacterium]
MRKMHDNIRLYHVDHLGSTSLVTDIDGEITQHVAYIPYGEVFVEERNGSWNTPYLFNAKELDEETGLYYYGARYLDPTHAAWLSVDPMFEKYVGMTPYNYCAGNPVKLVDPDGEEFAPNDNAARDPYRVTKADSDDYKLFTSCLNNIVDHGGDIGEKLRFLRDNPNFTVYVYVNRDGHNYYDETSNVLAWDPTYITLTDRGYMLPPVVQLAHEGRHAYDANIDWDCWNRDETYYIDLFLMESKTPGSPTGARDDNAIQSETECAKMYDIIPQDETSTRNNYNNLNTDASGKFLRRPKTTDVYKYEPALDE